MDQTIATAIFAAIMGMGFVVWAYSLVKALRIGGESAAMDEWQAGGQLPGQSLAESGERTIHGEPEKLSKALVRSLLQVNIGMFGSLFEVVERTAKRVVLKKTGPLVCNQPAGLYFSEAEFNFEPIGGDAVRVSYRLGYERLARLAKRVALGIIVGVGLPVMLIVGSLIWLLVIPAEEPAVRWQVFQTFQIGHALWPPFLMIWMYSVGRRHSKTFVSNLLTTLELAD
ncbi:MAG: hypothetical protein H8E44_38905 [Planctomycetes bacterium]|nr:hypothetical protein [Planctomycetota bacterium]MBL7038899.1 hypothetical protein [Pirellulaceae bacterium]